MTVTASIKNPVTKAAGICPKHLTYGPCGGVNADLACEVDANLRCPYLDCLDDLPWRHPDLTGTSRSGPAQGLSPLLAKLWEPDAFPVVVECFTADSADLSAQIGRYARVKAHFDAVNIADHAPSSPHCSSLAAAALFEQAGIETILNISCRDRNRIATEGEILGAAAVGVRNIFCITGDHPKVGNHPEAAGVFDLESFSLIAAARKLRDDGTMLSGTPLERAPIYAIGAAANPDSPPVELRAERVAAKVAAGANFIQTQPATSIDAVRAFAKRLADLGVFERARLIVGIPLITSLEHAEMLSSKLPGAQLPPSLLATFRRGPQSAAREAGMAFAADLLDALRAEPNIHGALIFPNHLAQDEMLPFVERLPQIAHR